MAIDQRTFTEGQALSAAVFLLRARERWSALASGALSRSRDGRSTSLSVLSASWYGAPGNSWRWELGAGASMLTTSQRRAAPGWQLALREHWRSSTSGASVGVLRAGLAHEVSTRDILSGELSWWKSARSTRWTISATTTWTEKDRFLFDDFKGDPVYAQDPWRFVQVETALRWIVGAVDVDAVVGPRLAWEGRGPTTMQGALSVAWWVAPRLALATGIGRQLDDPLRGTAEARYLSAALRLSARPGRLPRRSASDGPRLEATFDSSGTMLVRVVAADDAQAVQLMGDFTDWRALTLVFDGSSWSARVRVRAGARHVLLRVDGGPWMPPANLAIADDGLGGRVGLLVVP